MRGMSPETCESSSHWRYDGWAPEDPFLDVPLGIPAIVPHAMTTSDYWEVHVKKYGYPSLRWTWVCEGRSEASNGEVQMRPAKIMDQPYKYSGYSELNRGMKAVAQKLRKRRLDLKRLRPWYAKEYAFWSRTLYAETTLRSALVYLAETLRGRSFQQEATANESIEKLLKPHNRLLDLETVLPEKTRTSRMFYHAMGFLGQATLPVRRGTVTYTDSGVVEYPDRLRPALRRGFAGDAALVDQLVASGKAWADKKRTKTLYDNSEPSHDRELCMSNAHLAFRRWQVLGFFSASIVRDFEIEWQLLRRQMDQAPFEDVQLDWSPGTWPVLRHYFGETDHQTSVFFSAGEQMEQKGEGVDADIPVGAIARPAIPSAPSASAPAPWIPYYNTGEVGDHQRLNSARKWFCVWDGREIGIYDMTDLLVGVSWTKEARAHVTAPFTNPFCRMVRVDTMNQVWLDRFTTEQPLGYVARVRMKEDVRINDGKDGRPRWVMAGEDVYDVTNVELPPESQDLESIFAGSSHEDPVAKAVNLGYHPDVIHETLRPYWIGQVYKKGERRSRVHYVFTESEVRWHTTRETGIYIIIRGKVYDFTKFIDVHPGGSSIIAQIAGTDATAAWDKFHGSLYTDFPFDIHAQLDNLEIGRIVEERIQTAMTLSPNEICIRNCIYSKDRSDAHEEKKIIDLLDGYWGSDGTAEMEKPDAPEVYIRLWDRPWLIVAKLGTPRDKFPYMSPKVLGKMDGKERPGGFNESWVSNGHVVYNITSLVRCSSPISIVEKLKLRAGSRLEPAVAEDRALISFLENSCSHRIIGLLRAPKHGLTSLEKPVAWKTSYRRTPATKPKPAPQTGGSVSTAATPTPAPAPFTVRPLYPLRKKRKKTNDTGAGYPHPQGINLWLQNVAIDEPMGEPMDESPDDPMDDPIGDPMDMSRIAARTVLKKMGFPAQPGRKTADHERKKGGW
ncbi:cytochrome b5-like Heme/Steroid binding domain-containing protein [Colletotrichum sublineola]|nr:cytochrome b5-like Heme/Steroid binding domain-containing protein [Colletotrichum sublineola]